MKNTEFIMEVGQQVLAGKSITMEHVVALSRISQLRDARDA
jgi:hypothetical protein